MACWSRGVCVMILVLALRAVGGSIIECPTCTMLDYSGLMGSDDCSMKHEVGAGFAATYGYSAGNGSMCGLLNVEVIQSYISRSPWPHKLTQCDVAGHDVHDERGHPLLLGEDLRVDRGRR